LDGQTILVTGSCGSIGSEIARQLLKYNPGRLVLLDRSETGQFFLGRELNEAIEQGQIEIVIADTTDVPRLKRIFLQYRPQTIFHAAAYKHVPLMEEHPGEAVKNIVGSTRNLADLAVRFGVESFVMVSTDKAVNPTNVMGCCKRVAELYVQSLSDRGNASTTPSSVPCRFVTVRFGNVLGSAGSVIPVFREQISRGGPLTLTHPEMTRFFMTIPEASQLVIQAGRQGQGGEIFVLDMGQPVKIMDLARDMIKLSGLEPDEDVEIEIMGLRPGEKLYEELYADDETRLATKHPKILVAESLAMERRLIVERVDQLMQRAELGSDMVRQELKQIVPGYRPAAECGPPPIASPERSLPIPPRAA
ncbi:MAG: UDP-N-acetylglucosamine 4,6-dehydratase family protein, partial [Candidatus Paceibacterota bacterium]